MTEEGLAVIAKWQNLLKDIKDRKLWRVKFANVLKGNAEEEEEAEVDEEEAEELEEEQQYKAQSRFFRAFHDRFEFTKQIQN